MSMLRRIERVEAKAADFMKGRYKKQVVWALINDLTDEGKDPAETLLKLINIQKGNVTLKSL